MLRGEDDRGQHRPVIKGVLLFHARLSLGGSTAIVIRFLASEALGALLRKPHPRADCENEKRRTRDHANTIVWAVDQY